MEDGQEQHISVFSHESQTPISVGLLVDISNSSQDKLQQALQTVRAIAGRLTPDDEMFVITFNSHVNVRQKFTNVSSEVLRSLSNIRAHGETAVYDAIAGGLHEMQSAKYEKRILILVSDGFDTASRMNADQAESLIRKSDVLVYALGIDDGDQPVHHRARYHIYEYMLNKLAVAGGGRVLRLYTGQIYDLNILSDIFLRELHQKYTLGYYPAIKRGSPDSRTIDIRVSRPGAHVLSGKVRVQLGPSTASDLQYK